MRTIIKYNLDSDVIYKVKGDTEKIAEIISVSIFNHFRVFTPLTTDKEYIRIPTENARDDIRILAQTIDYISYLEDNAVDKINSEVIHENSITPTDKKIPFDLVDFANNQQRTRTKITDASIMQILYSIRAESLNNINRHFVNMHRRVYA